MSKMVLFVNFVLVNSNYLRQSTQRGDELQTSVFGRTALSRQQIHLHTHTHIHITNIVQDILADILFICKNRDCSNCVVFLILNKNDNFQMETRTIENATSSS